MKCGLRVFDENGNIDIDTSTGIAKYLGIITTGFEVGEIEDERLKGGRVWMIDISDEISEKVTVRHEYTDDTTMSGELKELDFPKIKFDTYSGKIKWDFTAGGYHKGAIMNYTIYYHRVSKKIMYGVF